jgi:hypothetical protein
MQTQTKEKVTVIQTLTTDTAWQIVVMMATERRIGEETAIGSPTLNEMTQTDETIATELVSE